MSNPRVPDRDKPTECEEKPSRGSWRRRECSPYVSPLLSARSTSVPPVARAEPRPEPAKKKKSAFGKPTTVLLLKNMVAPGDVDDDLSRETHLVRGPR